MKKNHTLSFDRISERLSRQKNKAVFIGGMNMDIQSIPDDKAIPGDSLIGKITLSAGGVVRNIAENCSLLGLDCSLMSVLGGDSAGDSILRDTKSSGVNTEHCLVLEDFRTSCYAAFLDNTGEMLYAVNDMSIVNHLTPVFFESKSRVLKEADYLILDTNIPTESIHYLCRTYSDKILLIDPVSAVKIGKIKDSLGTARLFKPNIVETEAFTGIPLLGKEDYYRALDLFHRVGVERIFISAGSKGIYYSDAGEKGRSEAFPVQIKSVTGAGDAASAALVLSTILGMNIKESAILANLTAASSLITSGTINKMLSLTYLENLYKELLNEQTLS